MNDHVQPRWEWRTFGDAFDAADRVLDALPTDREQESDEVYLLSVHNNTSVKLRDGGLDVKELQQEDEHGLELWKPVLKADFPISAADVTTALGALDASTALARDSYTRPQFLAEIVASDPELRAVPVRKHRRHYLVDECMVERTTFDSDDQHVRTIAIESTDPALVVQTVDRLGLTGRRNMNVARGLKTLVGFGIRRAVVDIGTNSVKFFAAERKADGTLRVLADRSEVTRLGEGLDATGRLSDAAIQRTIAAAAGMVEEARRLDASVIRVVGTAGLRIAENRQAAVEALRDACGVTIDIISGEEEARLAYIAATAALPLPPGPLLVFDSGGGSTQFSFGRPEAVDERFSMNVGAAKIAERFGLSNAVDQAVIDDACAAIADEFAALREHTKVQAVVGMGGTSTNLASVKHALAAYDADVVQGTVLDLAEIDRQIELYRTRDAAARGQIVGLQPNRAPVILAGACIVRTILTQLDRASFTVSDRALRHGVYAEEEDRRD